MKKSLNPMVVSPCIISISFIKYVVVLFNRTFSECPLKFQQVNMLKKITVYCNKENINTWKASWEKTTIVCNNRKLEKISASIISVRYWPKRKVVELIFHTSLSVCNGLMAIFSCWFTHFLMIVLLRKKFDYLYPHEHSVIFI